MPEYDSYDYVIAGAGSAGCVLANRLSADPSTRVLLLEAGGPDNAPEIHIPAAFPTLIATERDWGYHTVEQEWLGRPVYVPRGRMLGGSSSMNAMVYVRGNPTDFDGWRDTHGATGWGYRDVLPYFVRAEGNTRLGGPLHGTDGPLRVEDLVYRHELTPAWVESATEWGLKPNDDFNGESQLGAGPFQVTCRDGARWSAADAYLHPASRRPNLTVRTRAQVQRVLLGRGGAEGVTYRSIDPATGSPVGAEVTVRAESEVLLCGGSINSAQLLLLSGIGPADQLRALGIDVRADLLGVGANLHDHPTVPLIWTTRSTDLADLATQPDVLARYRTHRRGPLASNLCEVGAFFATDGSTSVPDVQVHAGPVAFADGLAKPDRPCFTTTLSLLAPRSRGTLRLRSADPGRPPELDLNLYADAADLTAMYTGLRALAEMSTTGTLLDQPLLPERAELDDATLTEHVRRWTQTMYHPVGTCAMGTGEDAVVDPTLRVRGVDRLRVVDASVMPTVVRGNTHAPTVMIAEKAAELIRGRVGEARTTSTNSLPAPS